MAGFPGEAESDCVDRDRFPFDNMDVWIAENFKCAPPPNEPTNNVGDITNPITDYDERLDYHFSLIAEHENNIKALRLEAMSGIEGNDADVTTLWEMSDAQNSLGIKARADIAKLEEEVDDCVDAGAFHLVIGKLNKRISELDTAIYNNMNSLEDDVNKRFDELDKDIDYIEEQNLEEITRLEKRIDGLEGGHNHPKFFKWLGWIK